MAKGVTVDLIVDPKKALQGLDQVEGKSSSVAGALGKLGGLAAAGVVALGTAAIAAAGALTAATLSAGAYAEEVQLAASKTHLTTDAVQELQYAAKITGVDFETISGSMTKLTKSMGAAQDGAGAQSEAFARLGVATTDANGNLLDSTVVYSNVIAALGQIENPAERDVLAMQLLGKSATELNPLIDGSAGSLAELAAQAQAAGAVLSSDNLAKLSSVDDAFDSLAAGADAAKNALGLTLMPVLQQLGDQGTGLLGQFTNAILDADGDLGKAAPAIGAVVSDAVSAILEMVPQLLEVGSSLISSLLTGIIQQAPSLITTAIPILAGFVTGLIGQLPMLLDAGLKILVALVQGITASLPTLIPAAVTALLGLVDALITNLPLLIDAGIQLVLGLALGLIEALPQLIDKIPELIIGIITALVGAIPQLVVAGVQLFLAIIKNLPAIILGIIEAVPLIVKGIADALTNPAFLGEMGNAGIALMQGFIDGIVSMIGAIGETVGGVMDFVAGFFPHSPAKRGPFSGSGWTQLKQSGLAIAGQLNSGLEAGFPDGLAGSVALTARAVVRTSPDATPAVGDGFTADPTLHTLIRNLINAVGQIQPGLVFPETVARTSQAGNGRLAALGAN